MKTLQPLDRPVGQIRSKCRPDASLVDGADSSHEARGHRQGGAGKVFVVHEAEAPATQGQVVHRASLRRRLGRLVNSFGRVVRETGLRAALYRTGDYLRRRTLRSLPRRPAAVFGSGGRSIAVDAVESPPPLPAHHAGVDIVVCVHNALGDVQRCLESVVLFTSFPYRLVIVDDGSDAETCDYLARFAGKQGASLIRNEAAEGYTLAANRGLRASSADYVVLLNSDTLVTPDWIDRLLACAEADEGVGLVGPLSNTASWQSIPEISNGKGDWADNALPEGVDAAEMGRSVARYAARSYPRVGFLNGFCLLIKRQVIRQVGLFDEATFGRGYGEENDYCLRARQAGWRLAVADDAYVYHAQSRSYSHERRKQLAANADKALAKKHGSRAIDGGLALTRDNRVLEGVRARTQVMWDRQRLVAAARERWAGRRVLVILPIMDPCGGGNVVWQEVMAMRRMGVDARIANLTQHRAGAGATDLESYVPVEYFEHPSDIAGALGDYDAVVATLYLSVFWIESSSSSGRQPVRGYYVQDFEPKFFEPGTESYQLAWDSYTRFPDLVRMTKTKWNREMVRERIGVDCVEVGPSVNLDLFRPRPRRDGDWPQRPLRIAVMVRPTTPWRQPEFTMGVVEKLYRRYGSRIEIVIFGCPEADPLLQAGRFQFPWRNAGILTPDKVASLLNESDVFADFSSYQAMGLTAMEAMACGIAVIVPQNGGAHCFARHEENSLIVDTLSEAACLAALVRLVDDESLRQRLAKRGMSDIVQHFPERVAYRMLAALFGE